MINPTFEAATAESTNDAIWHVTYAAAYPSNPDVITAETWTSVMDSTACDLNLTVEPAGAVTTENALHEFAASI